MIDAMCGLVASISSQFIQEDFSPIVRRVGESEQFQSAIGAYFQVRFPDDWPEDEKYQFDWHNLETSEPDPFEDIRFC